MLHHYKNTHEQKGNNMKNLMIHIICGFIPGRNRRNRIRMRLKHHKKMKQMVNFAKSFSNNKHPKIKTSIGFGCKNFVVIVDKNIVFKFPFKTNGKDIAIREQRITNALRPISSIDIPETDIIYWNNMAIRKYKFIQGISLESLSKKEKLQNIDIITKQLAKFLYEISSADPKEIRDLKRNPDDKPSFMYGWCQNDLWYNFIMDEKTLKIKGFIDWEDADFCDFHNCFQQEYIKSLKNKKVHNICLRDALLHKYIEIYMNNAKK